jgi:hypothetical protein
MDAEYIYASGRYVSEATFGLKDAFVVKISRRTGELVKEEIFGGIHVQFSGTVAVDGQGSVYSAGIGYVDQGLGESGDTVQDPYLEKRRASDLSLVKRITFGPGTNKEPWGGIAFLPRVGGRPGEGTIFVSGWTTGSFAPGVPQVGNGDVWLAAFDQDLNFLWVEQFGSPQRDWAWDLALDDEGFVYVAGHTLGAMSGAGPYRGEGDGYVSKFDPRRPQGQRLLWTRQLGTASSDEVRSIRFTGGELLVSGHTYGNMGGVNAGESDVWYARLNRDGVVLETRQVGTPGDERGFVTASPSGATYLGGFTTGSLTAPTAGSFDAFVLPLTRR